MAVGIDEEIGTKMGAVVVGGDTVGGDTVLVGIFTPRFIIPINPIPQPSPIPSILKPIRI